MTDSRSDPGRDVARLAASPATDAAWPALSYAAWKDTCSAVHLWTQVVGKIRLARTPWLNHSWHVPLYVSARGLTTSPIADAKRSFEIEFDFLDHRLTIATSDGGRARVELVPRSVAEFYAAVVNALGEVGIEVPIDDLPCEIAGAIRFGRDRAPRPYDAAAMQRFWRALVQADRVLKQFRTSFLGKCSPVHFFWGSFDLAVTRFSGRAAPSQAGPAPGVSAAVMREAYSHEVSSAGFWPGGDGFGDAAFYSYAYPEPAGFSASRVAPEGALYHPTLGQFLLPYEIVRAAPDPDATLLEFLETTYAAAADAAKWDRAGLEGPRGRPGVPRPLR